jgi:hypothetical protein
MTDNLDRIPGPDHLAAGETVTSASPKVTLGPAKAIIAAILGALGAAVPLAIAATADGAIDLNEGWGILGALLVGGGIIGGGTWVTPTKVTAN